MDWKSQNKTKLTWFNPNQLVAVKWKFPGWDINILCGLDIMLQVWSLFKSNWKKKAEIVIFDINFLIVRYLWQVLSDCNWTRSHNYLVCEWTLKHLAKLASFAPVSSKKFLDIQATIECGFTLKPVCDMIITYSQWQVFF